MTPRLAPALVAVFAAGTAVLPSSANAFVISGPRPGRYAGTEAFGTTPLPVKFMVARTRLKVRKFTAQAQVKDGCSNHITSFQTPTGPMSISADGHFSAVSHNYPQKGVRVRVSGVFTSQTKARGHISVRIAKHPECDARRPFHARRHAIHRPAAAE
jgi:hypothetical protein